MNTQTFGTAEQMALAVMACLEGRQPGGEVLPDVRFQAQQLTRALRQGDQSGALQLSQRLCGWLLGSESDLSAAHWQSTGWKHTR